MNANNDSLSKDNFIICGLGRLGQATLVNLVKFGHSSLPISVVAIDKTSLIDVEFIEVYTLLSQPIIVGDCRQLDLLEEAGVASARAILLLTKDESVNIETALLVRRHYPFVHIVIRSARSNLNSLLKNQLNQFVALNATELPAETFALAGLGDELLSIFAIEELQFRVIQREITGHDYGYVEIPLSETQQRQSRLLTFMPCATLDRNLEQTISGSSLFHCWQPDTCISAQDIISSIHVDSVSHHHSRLVSSNLVGWPWVKAFWNKFASIGWARRFYQFWLGDAQKSLRLVTKVAITSGFTLCVMSTLILKLAIPQLSWSRAFSLAVILILGGYGDIFGGLEDLAIPTWIYLVSLLIALMSLILVLSVFGLLIDELISSRFHFLQHRPKLPQSGHVIIVGFGRLGDRVIQILRELNQSMICITDQIPSSEILQKVPFLIGDVLQELKSANLPKAKSVIAITNDPILNLEMALMAKEQSQSPNFLAVIRSHDRYFSESIPILLPRGKAFSLNSISAEAFAGAAFGENIISLFQLNNKTILVTEYCIEPDDTLIHKLISQVSYGYGVVPILLRTENTLKVQEVQCFPNEDYQLHEGDRLYLLASINGLRRIERGELAQPPRWRIEVQVPLSREGTLEVGNILARITGIDLAQCRTFAHSLPASMELPLYAYQAHRLEKALKRWASTKLQSIS